MLTAAGSRELARRLLLTVSAASRNHGVMSDAENYSGQRRRLLRHLVHTLRCNEVFVAFATVARAVRARGGDDALEEWRSAAACERLGCHPAMAVIGAERQRTASFWSMTAGLNADVNTRASWMATTVIAQASLSMPSVTIGYRAVLPVAYMESGGGLPSLPAFELAITSSTM